MNSFNLSSIWLLDFGMSHHLTLTADQLPNSSLNLGSKVILVGNGNQLPISNVGSDVLHTNDSCVLNVNNLLHTPSVAINLLYVQKVCIDNNVFIEFHSGSFYVKDYNSKQVVL